MVEPINLRQFRKRKERDDKAAKADDNRKKSRLSKMAKNTLEKIKAFERKRLDGKKRDQDK